MKIKAEINGRKYKLNYWQYISYQNQMKIRELENKIKAPLRDKMGAVKILRDVFTEQTQSTEKEEGNKIEFIFKDASLKDE